MTTNTTTPLWRELNEDRTQGEWKVEKYPAVGYPNVIKSEFTSSHVALMGLPTEGEDNTVEAEANAKYTALAVNNLARLAEALETALARLGTFAESNAWDPEDEQAYNIAAKALEAISKRPE